MRAGSASYVVQDSLRRLIENSSNMPWCAEKVFWKLVDIESRNVFLNLPHLFEILTLFTIVGHSEPARVIKEQLFLLDRHEAKNRGISRAFYNNPNYERLVSETAAHDLLVWDQKIRHQCMDNEYASRRRVYMNRMACRSYSYPTFSAMNSMNFEWRVSDGTGELAKWVHGSDPLGPGEKCPFKVWEYDDENREAAEELKERQKKKMKERKDIITAQKIQNSHKCPLLLAVTHFQIPVHPILLDTRATYTLCVNKGIPVRMMRFINDTTKMLRYYQFGDGGSLEQQAAMIPCRNRDNNMTMKMVVFWGQEGSHCLRIADMLRNVLGGSNTQFGGVNSVEIKELHMPHWSSSPDAVNLGDPIRQSLSDHLFAEGGFGDLAEPGVIPCAAEHNDVPPSIQTFDNVTIRFPADSCICQKDLADATKDVDGIVRVSLPYTVVVYDDLVKMPIYLGRVVEPELYSKDGKRDRKGPHCTIQ